MEKLRIPGTTLDASRIVMGGVQLIDETDTPLSFRLLDTYVDCGGNFLDTANIYGKWLPEARNSSERNIGAWLKARGNRDSLIIGTKGAHPEISTMEVPRMSEPEVRHDLEESLRALGIDRIDLYWLHRDDRNKPVEEILSLLEKFVKEGHIRHYGCSNWRTDRIREAIHISREKGWQGFCANQMQWSMAILNRENIGDKTTVDMDDGMLALHRDTGLAAIPYSSQAMGLFEKWARNPEAGCPKELAGPYGNPDNEVKFEQLLQESRETGNTLTQLALSWLLAHPFPTFPIIGSRTVEQVRASMAI